MALKILYIDDDPDDREIFSDSVQEIDPDAKVYEDDGQNFEQYLTPPLPDIIFLDFNMPYKNGIECLRQIRNNKELDNIPVVFYSVYYDKIQEAYVNGANYFLVKQVKSEKIPKAALALC